MIKVVNLVALIVAPVVVTYKTLGFSGWLIVLILIAALVWAIFQSKRPAKEIAPSAVSGD